MATLDWIVLGIYFAILFGNDKGVWVPFEEVEEKVVRIILWQGFAVDLPDDLQVIFAEFTDVEGLQHGFCLL